MNKFVKRLAAPVEILRLIKRHEPLYLCYSFPQILLNAVLPLLYVFFPKLIIEQLTDGGAYSGIMTTILIYAAVLLCLNIANVFLKNKSDMLAVTFSSKLKFEIGQISLKLGLADIESPLARDAIQLANKAGELTKAMELVGGILSNGITIIGLGYIIVYLDSLFLFLVALTLIVKSIFVYSQYVYRKTVRVDDAENSRHGDYLYQLTYSEGGAKEIRLNNLQKWYMRKIRSFRDKMLSIQFIDFKRTTLHNIVIAVITAIQSLIVLWLLSRKYIDGTISIADFTMYFSAVVSLTASLSAISERLGNYSGQIVNLSDYTNFTAFAPSKEDSIPSQTPDFIVPEKIEIVFKNVSFAYPNTDRQVLKNINITISNNEKLVIVGSNGAGKSTFIKLLCKFYRPTDGIITLNGVNIWDISGDTYYRTLSAVFQDFVNFPFALKENITMREDEDAGAINRIINNLGLEKRISALPGGLDTYLTKEFSSEGVELSGGQGQKLAIARAIYRDTPVIILDEPTANLDPKAEAEIYTDFFHMAKHKTAIFISHRLSASVIADTIAVFEDGQIVEYGAHNVLLSKNGIYAQMYQKQSEQYIDAQKVF